MRIISIYLKGYKPLKLSNIQEITYTPDSILQIILGKNGSGKSSLLRAASPLPAENNEYDPDGIKIVEIEHRGANYILKSKLGKDSNHSFLRNGEELNDGGKITIQKELVEREFSYTAKIHKLLTGKMSFTEMKGQDRKNLLLGLSDTGIDYAIDIFDKVRMLNRDYVGAIKHVAVKVDELTNRQMSHERINEVREASQALVRDITRIMPYSNMSLTTEPMPTKLSSIIKDIETKASKAEKVFKGVGNKLSKYGSLDNAIRFLEIERANVVALDAETNSINEQLAFYEDAIKRMEETKHEDPASIESKLKDIADKLNSVTKPETLVEATQQNADVCMTAYRFLEKVASSYAGIEIYSRDDVAEITALVESNLSDINNTKIKLRALSNKLEAAKHASECDQTCPKCNHTVLAEGSLPKDQLELLNSRIIKGKQILSDLEEKQKTLDIKNEKVSKYTSAFNQVKSLIDNTIVLEPIWNLLDGPNNVISNCFMALQEFVNQRQSILDVMEYNALVEEKSRLEGLLEALRLNNDNADLVRVNELEKRLDEIILARNKANDFVSLTESSIKAYKEFISLHEDLNNLYNLYANDYISWMNELGQFETNKELTKLQQQLAENKSILAAYESIQSSLTEMEEDLESLKKKKLISGYLMRALSPKEGIIAEAMRSVIQGFMDDVNVIISNVWEYPMSIGISKSGWKNLDYNFTLHVDENSVDEISKGSEGQKDIIDFAVTLCIMKRLKLLDYPLYLDEIGNTFDQKHRRNLLDYIRRLVETGMCSQMFLINHYSTEHGGLSNADIIVLSADNIVVPENHNRVVEIK